MNQPQCDFSPMKQRLSQGMLQIKNELQQSVEVLNKEEFCLLSNLEQIKNKFIELESIAASFYLNCYLSAFTDKFEDLAISLQRLSEKQHGALIVIERKDPLDAFIQKGVNVNATLTPALLEAIFYPGNALHDGAVLIQDNLIVSAANILPLTSTIIAGKKLGTRHRAALGLSEISDALILVVSEETGKVTFALNGTLYPINTKLSLMN